METAQEREVRLQGRQAWPFHMMATTSCFDNYSSSSGGGGGDCFVLGWEQPLFGCSFGVLAAADVHELFPLFAGMESPLPVSSALAVPPPPAQDAVAMPEELDDLLLDFWDASCHDGDVDERQVQVAFNSSCFMQHEKSCTATATATTNSSFHYDDDPLSSIFSAGPAVPDQALLQAPAEPLSSSSSNCHADPHVGDSSGTPAATPSAARAPPMPRSSSSLKRSTREGAGLVLSRRARAHSFVRANHAARANRRRRWSLRRGVGSGGVQPERRQAEEDRVAVAVAGDRGGVPVRAAEARRAGRRRDAGGHQRAHPHAPRAARAAPRGRVRVRAARVRGPAGHLGQGRLQLHPAAHPRPRHHNHHKNARLTRLHVSCVRPSI
ncbi:uncharacterized protein LOC133901959 isoform X1 [Phragmites australis]|uniref:uncharacterized protein LOC133901959 isoform X1 n=1 Tax=Phragmites australis TaxID=29695 RepID=UPI002D7A27EC|nr:uncharacterized protein LOC133901959 isoform X1 [Phragmites australis]